MNTVEELIYFILQHDQTIVFGDLGRYPHQLLENLRSIPSLQIVIITHNALSYSDNRIRILDHHDKIDAKCDLLIYLEPLSLSVTEKHPLASHVVVFTSHFSFIPKGEHWIYVCYFLKMDFEGTRELLEKQDISIQTENVGLVEANYTNVMTISGLEPVAPKNSNTCIIINLTNFNRDILSMYLAFWNAFDYMLEHKSFIDRWFICFSDQGDHALFRFTQKVLDIVFCQKFEHGNVTNISKILALLPFYKSGTIDKKFYIESFNFGGLQIVNPININQACQIAMMHDVIALVNNVYWVKV